MSNSFLTDLFWISRSCIYYASHNIRILSDKDLGIPYIEDINHSWTLPKYLTLTYFSNFQGQTDSLDKPEYIDMTFWLAIFFHLLNLLSLIKFAPYHKLRGGGGERHF